MSEITVFISYSHDSDAHRERVLGLSERLRADGIATILDRYVEKGSPPEGWPRWMINGLNAATHVVCVCTETYRRRFLGLEDPGKGRGVDWEGTLVTQACYDSRRQTEKFIPIVFDRADEPHIPEPLRPQTRYVLDSEEGYQALYDALLDQAGVEPGALGTLEPKPRATGQPLRFGGSPGAPAPVPTDISRIIKYAPAELVGREAETKILADAWAQAVRGETPRPHVLTFVALGGEGKTSLVAKWAAELAHRDWPGCEAAFAWSFYSQGTREQLAASSDLFLAAALTFFGDPEMAGSAQGAFDKGRRLAQLVGQRRALLVLDGLEPLQFAPTSPTPRQLKDQGLAALLKGLAGSSRGLCVVTTRYSLPDLKAFWQTTAPEHELKRLSLAAGVALLKKLGVQGSERPGTSRRSGPTRDPRLAPGDSQALNEFEQLVEDVRGHALTLNLLGTYLHDAHAGDIRKRDLVKLEEADAEEQGGHAFRVMDAYVRWLQEEQGGKGEGEQRRKGERRRQSWWRRWFSPSPFLPFSSSCRPSPVGPVRPARDRRLFGRVAGTARDPGPDRGAGRDERGAAERGLRTAGDCEAADREPGRGRDAGLAGCAPADPRVFCAGTHTNPTRKRGSTGRQRCCGRSLACASG